MSAFLHNQFELILIHILTGQAHVPLNLITIRHLANQRNLHILEILAVAQAGIHVLDEQEDAGRDNETQYQCDKHNLLRLWRYGSVGTERR